MEDFSELELIMGDLNQRKESLNGQLKEFKSLQGEINRLVEQAPRDPSAVEKLMKLKGEYESGLDIVQNNVQCKVNQIHKNFQMLEQQFSELNQVNEENPITLAQQDDDGSEKSSVVDKKDQKKVKKIRRYL